MTRGEMPNIWANTGMLNLRYGLTKALCTGRALQIPDCNISQGCNLMLCARVPPIWLLLL